MQQALGEVSQLCVWIRNEQTFELRKVPCEKEGLKVCFIESSFQNDAYK